MNDEEQMEINSLVANCKGLRHWPDGDCIDLADKIVLLVKSLSDEERNELANLIRGES